MKKVSSMLGAHVWDPERYWLVKRSFWLESVKRGLRSCGVIHGDRLFLYVSKATGVPVLGYWVKERPGGLVRVFVSLTSLRAYPEEHPELMPSLEYIRLRIKPAREQARAGIRSLREEESKELAREEREEEAKKEWLKYVKNKDADLYRLVSTSRIPVSFDESNERLTEGLARIASRANKRQMVVKE